jgi:hypothetical protein
VHTHLEYSSLRGLVDDLPYSQWKLQLLDREQRFDAEDWEDSARLGAAEALQSGITTIADITETGASARAAAGAGLRAVIYREVSTMEKRKVAGVMARATEDMAVWREYGDPSRLTIGIAPHATYSCHPEVYRQVAEKAIGEDLPVSMHIAGSKDEHDFVKYGSSRLAVDYRDTYTGTDLGWLPTGVSPVRYLDQWGLFEVPQLLAVHCTQVDDADVEILVEHDVAVAYCPRCNAKLGMGIAPSGGCSIAACGWASARTPRRRTTHSTCSTRCVSDCSSSGRLRIRAPPHRAPVREDGDARRRPGARAGRRDRLAGARQAGRHHRSRHIPQPPDPDALPLQHPRAHRQPGERGVHHGRRSGALRHGRWSLLDIDRIQARAEEMRIKLRS